MDDNVLLAGLALVANQHEDDLRYQMKQVAILMDEQEDGGESIANMLELLLTEWTMCADLGATTATKNSTSGSGFEERDLREAA